MGMAVCMATTVFIMMINSVVKSTKLNYLSLGYPRFEI